MQDFARSRGKSPRQTKILVPRMLKRSTNAQMAMFDNTYQVLILYRIAKQSYKGEDHAF
jgi:hypothetical protein